MNLLPSDVRPDIALPELDRRVLRLVQALVPVASRDEWHRGWEAELWHIHDRCTRRRIRPFTLVLDHFIGLTRDALWLRTDHCRAALEGTPTLCLVALVAYNLAATLVCFLMAGSWAALAAYLDGPLDRSLVAALIVTFVAFATASNKHIGETSSGEPFNWLKRQLFLAAKTVSVLLIAFLLSVDLCLPLHRELPNTADLLQVFCFVLLGLVGVRWALQDQEGRCKRCLHRLAMPARVGRPSHNLLEWNGTELSCKQGHGLLSVPEMETSWCRASQWIDRWDQAASV